ncbi:MAG: hypothetical protein ABSF94_03980 [Steroidobacteraceae bacterium]|jgi:outer membrane biogenesis lipoprotein LolB
MPILHKNAILLASLCGLVSACASTPPRSAWVKSSASSQEFYQTQEQCLQNSQRRESYAEGAEVVITDVDRFSSCLHSRGWVLQTLAKN